MQIPLILKTPRAAMTAVFVAFGAAVGAQAGSMPVIVRAAGVDSFALGLAIAVSTVGSIMVMSCGGMIARHFSSRAVLLASLPSFGLLSLALLTSSSPLWFFVAFFLIGINFGLTDIFMNAEAAAVEHDMGKPIFSAFHGSVSLGMPAFAILSSFLSVQVGSWATGLCVCAMFALAWVMVRRIIPARALASGKGAHMATLPNKTPLFLLGLAAGLIMAGEIAAILWSARLLDEQAPELAAIAGLGAAFHGLCNASLRLPGDALRARFGELPLMMASLCVAMLGFAALGLSPSFAFSVAAFALVGLGTAVLIPCAFALAARLAPGNRAAGMGFISTVAGLPRILGPWIFGWMAAATSISAAFGFYAAVMAVALGLIAFLHRSRRLT